MSLLSQKRLTYATLSGIFVLAVAAFGLWHSATMALTPLLGIELAFAVYRLGRMVSYDRVMETYRLPFVRTIPDPTGEGETTRAVGSGWREAIGDLICCPICAGTWIAAVLVIGLNVLPGVTQLFVAIFAIVGVAELLNGATEFLQWNGQMAREYAGTMALAKKHAREQAEADLRVVAPQPAPKLAETPRAGKPPLEPTPRGEPRVVSGSKVGTPGLPSRR